MSTFASAKGRPRSREPKIGQARVASVIGTIGMSASVFGGWERCTGLGMSLVGSAHPTKTDGLLPLAENHRAGAQAVGDDRQPLEERLDRMDELCRQCRAEEWHEADVLQRDDAVSGVAAPRSKERRPKRPFFVLAVIRGALLDDLQDG